MTLTKSELRSLIMECMEESNYYDEKFDFSKTITNIKKSGEKLYNNSPMGKKKQAAIAAQRKANIKKKVGISAGLLALVAVGCAGAYVGTNMANSKSKEPEYSNSWSMTIGNQTVSGSFSSADVVKAASDVFDEISADSYGIGDIIKEYTSKYELATDSEVRKVAKTIESKLDDTTDDLLAAVKAAIKNGELTKYNNTSKSLLDSAYECIKNNCEEIIPERTEKLLLGGPNSDLDISWCADECAERIYNVYLDSLDKALKKLDVEGLDDVESAIMRSPNYDATRELGANVIDKVNKGLNAIDSGVDTASDAIGSAKNKLDKAGSSIKNFFNSEQYSESIRFNKRKANMIIESVLDEYI